MSHERTGRGRPFRSLAITLSRIEGGAALWGVAEATLFFLVPDIWLTAWASRKPKRALAACAFALIGAMVGGAIMYAWGSTNPDSALAAVERVPAVSEQMIADVDTAMRADGAVALFGGMINGTPYKLFAVTAGAQHIGLMSFLLVSIPARLIRFLTFTVLTVIVARITRRWLRPAVQTTLILVGWGIFYAVFFTMMPN